MVFTTREHLGCRGLVSAEDRSQGVPVLSWTVPWRFLLLSRRRRKSVFQTNIRRITLSRFKKGASGPQLQKTLETSSEVYVSCSGQTKRITPKEKETKKPFSGSCSAKEVWWVGKSYLHSQNAKDDKESTTDQDNVADRPERRDQRLDHEFQTWSSADDPGEERNIFFSPSQFQTPQEIFSPPEETDSWEPYFITFKHSGSLPPSLIFYCMLHDEKQDLKGRRQQMEEVQFGSLRMLLVWRRLGP